MSHFNRIKFTLLFISFYYLNSFAQFTFTTGTATATGKGSQTCRLLNDITTNAQLSIYGGNLNATGTSTGYFHTQLINSCWYLVDPAGYLFYTVGVCSVVEGGNVALPESLWDIAANTMGCWSDETINTGASRKMAYCPRWNFMATYKNTNTRTKALYTAGIIPVFDPAYITFCDSHAQQLTANKNDPYILGHFSDNELTIYDNTTYGNLLDRFLAITDKTDPNYLAAYNWIVARKGTNYSITSTDREVFHGYVTGTYYKITGEAIKKYDPNHMYLGSRLHGAAKDKPSIFIEAAKYVDMISINVYGTWCPTKSDMDRWSAGGAPFFVTEFYVKAEDSGMDNIDGAGWLVPTQTDRAKFFENFTLALLEHPGSVGYHHFKYIDDGGANKGLVSLTYQWYTTLTNSFYKIGRDVYALREFLTGKSTTQITETKTGESLQLFGNSTKNEYTIESTDLVNQLDINVYSTTGIKLQHFTTSNLPYVISLDKLPAGIYIISGKQGNKSINKQVSKSS